MNNIRHTILITTFLLGLGGMQVATAVTITSSLGNTASGFVDGSTQTVPAVGTAQGGQPAPFDGGYGTDGLFGGNFMKSWQHDFAIPVDPIRSATLTIGIFDHDSAATGSQLEMFSVDGNDFTTELNTLFEAGGGSPDLGYNEYTLSLGTGVFGDLLDGSVVLTLNLLGPGLVTPLFPLPGPNPPTETSTNGANLIFSTLTIQPVPIPAAAPLFMSALILLGLYRRRINI